MSTNINTARPSRARLVWARIASAHERLDTRLNDRLPTVFATLAGLFATASVIVLPIVMVTDYGVTVYDALTAVFAVAISVGGVAVCVGIASSEHTERELSRLNRRTLARVISERDEWADKARHATQLLTQGSQMVTELLASLDEAIALATSLRDERDEARRERDENERLVGMAYSLLRSRDSVNIERVIDERDEARGERNDIAHLALRMSGIDLPDGVDVHTARLAVFHAARGEFESCDDMTDEDYMGAYDRIAKIAFDSSPIA